MRAGITSELSPSSLLPSLLPPFLPPLQEAPRGHPDCLTGKTFVISGVLDSLYRKDCQDGAI